MFFKQVFLSAFIFISFVSYAQPGTPDIVPSLHHGKETRIVPCDDCRAPDQGCKNYVITPTNKICLFSDAESQVSNVTEPNNTAAKEKSSHKEANAEDKLNLEESIGGPKNNFTDSIEGTDIEKLENKGPVLEE